MVGRLEALPGIASCCQCSEDHACHGDGVLNRFATHKLPVYFRNSGRGAGLSVRVRWLRCHGHGHGHGHAHAHGHGHGGSQ